MRNVHKNLLYSLAFRNTEAVSVGIRNEIHGQDVSKVPGVMLPSMLPSQTSHLPMSSAFKRLPLAPRDDTDFPKGMAYTAKNDAKGQQAKTNLAETGNFCWLLLPRAGTHMHGLSMTARNKPCLGCNGCNLVQWQGSVSITAINAPMPSSKAHFLWGHKNPKAQHWVRDQCRRSGSKY